MKNIIITIVACFVLSGTFSDSMASEIHQCDQLAAHPEDINRPKGVNGVPVDKIDWQEAIAACESAVGTNPTPRYLYQLGRAYEKANRFADAIESYKRSQYS